MVAESPHGREFIKCSVRTCNDRAEDAALDLRLDVGDGRLVEYPQAAQDWPGVCPFHCAGYILALAMWRAAGEPVKEVGDGP